ncbi:MAG: exodeoxyribonuclease VII large subunit [Chloroflexota bacterium]|nr:exodeoxyribonuclease VII large subunit [Chloroflexota bacterium]
MTLPQQAVLTVSQVAVHLREMLESHPFLSDLWIVGEVSNLRASSSGHSYFTLKDSSASLNCVLFRGQGGAGMLENGKSVRAHGRMSFYEPRGSTDFMVDRVLPEGEGALAQELERLKMRLGQEGLFEESRKRPLPQFPEVVGVVTSPTGAAWQDIQNVVRRRYPLARLLLSPTQVQGLEAAPQIAGALDLLDSDGSADVIIVARGGGSLEDLWPFNEEIVARAIFRNRIPVVSGVGHETDFTIADYVADRRAPTPSAAAELVVPDGSILLQTVQAWTERAHRSAIRAVDASKQEVSSLSRRLESGLPDLDHLKRQVDDLADVLGTNLQSRLNVSRLEVNSFESRLRTLDPAATLRRGFAVVQHRGTGQVVSGAAQVNNGDSLTITVSDGVFPATAGDGALAAADPATPVDIPRPPAVAGPESSSAPAPGKGTSEGAEPAPQARPARRGRRRPPEPPAMDRLL